MSIPDKLKEHVKNQDINSIRIMLKNIIIADPTFGEFNELNSYVKENHIDIYEKYDGKVFEEDITKWNKDYLNTECIRLVANFSEERVKHIRKVCKVVYKERIELINKERNDSEKKTATDKGNNFAKKDTKEEKINFVYTKPYASTTKGKSTIAAVGSSAIVATGIIIEKTAIIVGGAAIAIGGLVLITILEKNNKNKK